MKLLEKAIEMFIAVGVCINPLVGGTVCWPRNGQELAELEIDAESMRKEFPELSAKLADFAAKYKEGKFGPPSHQLGDRFLLARRLEQNLRRHLSANDADTLFFVQREMGDLRLFLRFFAEKEQAYDRAATSGKPGVISLRDFGAKGDGVSDDSAALIAAIDALAKYQGKPVKLEIPAGKYLLDRSFPLTRIRKPFGPGNPAQTTYQWFGHMILNNLKNVTISGEKDKTTLLFGDWERNGILMAASENVRIENLILRCKTPPFMQGTIRQTLPAEKGVLWEPDPGFILPEDPRNQKILSCCQCYDADTGRIVPGASHFFYEQKFQKLADGTYKLIFREYLSGLRRGMKLVIPIRKGAAGSAYIADSKFCVFDNITIYDSRGGGFTDVTSFGNEYLNCRIIPDKAARAVFSSNADGIHCQNDEFGVYVEKCEFRHQGDDAFNTYTKGRLLDAVVPDGTIAQWGYPEGTIFSVVSSLNGQIKAGRVSRGIGEDKLPAGGLRPKSLFPRPLPADIVTYASLKQKALTQEEMTKVQIGFKEQTLPDILFAHGKSGVGTVIRDSVFEGNRNNLLVVQTSSALIEGNRLDGCTYHGIFICALIYPWQEGFHPFNVVIRNNQIDRVAIGIGARMKGADAKCKEIPAIFDLAVENNTIGECFKGKPYDLCNQVERK